MKGLLIKEKWLNKILDGDKTWEIRSKKTNVRGGIALIQSGSGQVMGVSEIVDCIGPLTAEEFESNFDKHRVDPGTMSKFNYKEIYAWVIHHAERLDSPVPYKHPNGAVIWVNLDLNI
jgi:hypothetical protein